MGEFIHRFFREEPTGRPVSARGELLIYGNSLLPHSFSIHCEGCVIQVGGDVDLVVEFALSAFNQPVVIPSPEDEPSLLSPPGSDDHGNASFSATPLFPGEGLTGAIDPRGDVDFFSFQAHAGEAYSILVILGTLRDSSVALRVSLFGPFRRQLSSGPTSRSHWPMLPHRCRLIGLPTVRRRHD